MKKIRKRIGKIFVKVIVFCLVIGALLWAKEKIVALFSNSIESGLESGLEALVDDGDGDGDAYTFNITYEPVNTPGYSSYPFAIDYIDVGQADSTLIRCIDEYVLIDGGNVEDGDDVVAFLHSRGVEELRCVVCTHAHEDHVGGLTDVLREFTVSEVWAPATGADTKCYKNFVDAVNAQNIEVTVPSVGDRIRFGGLATMTVVGPITEDYDDINNTSLVIEVSYVGYNFLFMGDAEYESETAILDSGYNHQVEVLKVGHHGSDSSTGYRLLREVQPKYAVISCGADNKYGHPHDNTLSRLRDAEVTVYRTDKNGTVTLLGNSMGFCFETERTEG